MTSVRMGRRVSPAEPAMCVRVPQDSQADIVKKVCGVDNSLSKHLAIHTLNFLQNYQICVSLDSFLPYLIIKAL